MALLTMALLIRRQGVVAGGARLTRRLSEQPRGTPARAKRPRPGLRSPEERAGSWPTHRGSGLYTARRAATPPQPRLPPDGSSGLGRAMPRPTHLPYSSFLIARRIVELATRCLRLVGARPRREAWPRPLRSSTLSSRSRGRGRSRRRSRWRSERRSRRRSGLRSRASAHHEER